MKPIKLFFLVKLIFILILVSQSSIAQKNIYEKDIIRIKNKNVGHAGEFKQGVITNEGVEMDIYVKDFSVDNARKVYGYYKKFYLEKAKKLNNRLTIEINFWSKKLSASDIIDGPDFNEPATNQKQFFKSAKWKQYLKLEEKYLHGGIIYNYANGASNEDIY